MSRAVRKGNVTLRLNDRGVADVLNSAEVRAALREAAEPIAARARSSAPVDSGAYRDGIEVDVEPGDRRAHARVTATDRKSLVIEAAFGVLQRALTGRGRVARTSQVAADRRAVARQRRADRAMDRRTSAAENAAEF